jgi:hypothetical protein
MTNEIGCFIQITNQVRVNSRKRKKFCEIRHRILQSYDLQWLPILYKYS